MLERILGKYIKIELNDGKHKVHWKRIWIIVLIILVMSAFWFAANKMGYEELWDQPLFQLNTNQSLIFVGIWAALLLLLLFGRKAVLLIDDKQIVFQKNVLIPRKHLILISDFQGLLAVEKKDYSDIEGGRIPIVLYKLYVLYGQGQRLKLHSFSMDQINEIKEVFEKHLDYKIDIRKK